MQIFTLEGGLLGSFGGPGTGPGQFNTPYGIALEGDRLLVVDRTNNRLQRFRIVRRALTN